MSALAPKHQRLVLIVVSLAALIGAGLLAAWALRNQASYFYLPADMAAALSRGALTLGDVRRWVALAPVRLRRSPIRPSRQPPATTLWPRSSRRACW